MINLEQEKDWLLSAQDRYTILSFATQAADEEGFVNHFIFERALWLYAAIMLLEDEKAEIVREATAENLMKAWNTFVHDGTLQELRDYYAPELDHLAEEAVDWLDNYEQFAYSARGIMNTVQQFTGDIVEAAAGRLSDASALGGAQLLQFADDWGMNRQAAPAEESLFKEE